VTGFALDVATVLRKAATVRIETSAGDGRPVHRTIVWIVVDETGRAFVRSHRGGRGRWYRELIANPEGVVVVGPRRIRINAAPADQAGIEVCSRLLSEKYASSRASLASMLRNEILETTLELHPG